MRVDPPTSEQYVRGHKAKPSSRQCSEAVLERYDSSIEK